MPTWAIGLIAAVVVVVVLGVIGAAFLSTRQQPTGETPPPPSPPPPSPPPPPPTQPNYDAELTVNCYNSALQYQGKTPERTYFLLVNVTVNNTGDTAFRVGRTDIWLADLDGNWIAYPDARFHPDADIASGSSATVTLVFDLPSYASPAKITLSLPDGSRVSAWLSSRNC